MDVILGEDESIPSNRIALICKQCRLVNGQAPPGVKRLEEVGKWRCGECGAMNGEDTEVKKILAGLKEEDEEGPNEKHHHLKTGNGKGKGGGYSPSPSSKDQNPGNRSLTGKREKTVQDEDEEDELAKDQPEIIADSETEESDVTQYSDASASDPVIAEVFEEPDAPPSNAKSKDFEERDTPEASIRVEAGAEVGTEAGTEETPMRRRAGRPKGSRNKR